MCFCMTSEQPLFLVWDELFSTQEYTFSKDEKKSVGCPMTTGMCLVHLKVKAGRSSIQILTGRSVSNYIIE